MIFQLPDGLRLPVYYQILSGRSPELQGEGQQPRQDGSQSPQVWVAVGLPSPVPGPLRPGLGCLFPCCSGSVTSPSSLATQHS